jgi:hypothetical protein
MVATPEQLEARLGALRDEVAQTRDYGAQHGADHARSGRDPVRLVMQKGAGVPTHKAAEGTLYWDETNDDFYVNNNGITSWTSVGGASVSPHVILDGSVHTDTVGDTVSRGSMVVGNATPKWDELTVGAADRYLKSDGTDLAWGQVGHDELSDVAATDHHSNANDHAESHAPESHTDTDITGAELETLSDGSNADTEHEHALIKNSGGDAKVEVTGSGAGGAVKFTVDGSVRAQVLPDQFLLQVPLSLNQVPVAISGGTFATTKSYHRVETEGGAGSDELDHITGKGDWLILHLFNDTHHVVFKHDVAPATDRLLLADGQDWTMTEFADYIILARSDETPDTWREVARSENYDHKDAHDPEDGADALDSANAAEISVVVAAGTGTSHSLARADHIHALSHAISDNHLVTVDHAAVADNDYAKFTASGLEGRSYSEVRSDLNVAGAGLEFQIDGGGSVITAGIAGWLEVPFDCTITAARLLADQTGSIKIDIWKDTYANYPPTNADTITGGNEPEISAAIKDEDTTLTSWTTSLTKGDILYFNVDSVATIERCLVSLSVDRS